MDGMDTARHTDVTVNAHIIGSSEWQRTSSTHSLITAHRPPSSTAPLTVSAASRHHITLASHRISSSRADTGSVAQQNTHVLSHFISSLTASTSNSTHLTSQHWYDIHTAFSLSLCVCRSSTLSIAFSWSSHVCSLVLPAIPLCAAALSASVSLFCLSGRAALPLCSTLLSLPTSPRRRWG